MRLIDGDALLDKLPKEYLGSTVHLLINNAPTVATDRPQGRWIHDTHYGVNLPEHQCSICGVWEYSDEESNYCSNCGAYMGGGDD